VGRCQAFGLAGANLVRFPGLLEGLLKPVATDSGLAKRGCQMSGNLQLGRQGALPLFGYRPGGLTGGLVLRGYPFAFLQSVF
jgi:hypothetical protein